MEELKMRIKAAGKHGITRKFIAKKIGIPYPYLNQYLNECAYSPMPNHILKAIDDILSEVENG